MKNLFKFFVGGMFCFTGIFGVNYSACCQEKGDSVASPFSLNVDFVSRYIWRGIQFSQSPAIQANAFYTKGNFSIGTWSSYTMDKEPLQELDIIASYSIGRFSVNLVDFFNPIDTVVFSNFFNWKSNETNHLIECMVTYNGSEKFPVQILAGVAFFGNDRDVNGKNQYSTYFEVNYALEYKDYTVKPFVGITPRKGFYCEKGFNVVNTGLTIAKLLKINDHFSLPLSTSIIANPYKNNVFMVFSVSL